MDASEAHSPLVDEPGNELRIHCVAASTRFFCHEARAAGTLLMKTTLAAWMRNGPLEADRPQGIPGGDEKEETRQHRIFRAIYLIVRTP